MKSDFVQRGKSKRILICPICGLRQKAQVLTISKNGNLERVRCVKCGYEDHYRAFGYPSDEFKRGSTKGKHWGREC